MISKIVINGEGKVEAKDLTKLIHKASRFRSQIFIEKDERKANGKSLMGLLSLAVKGGDNINIIVEGDDEKEAAKSLTEFINNNFSD
jgi:phosphotransferase system HPr (HPr) family protein